MEAKKLRVQFERRVDSPWSWVICFTSFMSQFIIGGTHNAFGSFFVGLLQKFHRSEAETAWIGSLAVGITYMSAPIVTNLCDRWGCRVVMCLGSVIYMIGMLMTSFVPYMSLMYLTYGVIVGFASSCCYFSSFSALIIYFNKHLALANGIAAAGAGAGTLSLSIIVNWLISTYNLTIAYQFMAASSCLLFLAGLTFLPIDGRKEDELLKKEIMKEQEQVKLKHKFISNIKELMKPAPVWKNKAFIAWTVAMTMVLIAYYIPYIYLVRLAERVGIPSRQGALLVGYFGLSQTFGKILFGKLGDSSRISRLTLTQISLLVMAVAACLCPLARSNSALLTYSLVSGMFDGCLSVMIGLVTHDIVGRQMMAAAVGTLYSIVAIPMMAGPPMAGLLYDCVGSYNIVFFLSSGLVFGGSCIMFLIPNLLPSKGNLRKVLIPEIRVSSNDILDIHDDFIDDQKAKLTSQVSLQSFADEFEINRSRLLIDRANLPGSRPNSFILFSIVPEGSFRDLSMSNERYSTSREASYTSLARLSEIRVDSRTNSCAKLKPVAEAVTSDASVSSEFLDVIIEPSAEIELITSLSRDSIDNVTSEEEGEHAIMKSDHNSKDILPNIIISESTESGFISEEFDTCTYIENYDTKETVSPTSDLDEKRLSGYSWNSTGSDISWKTQCSEADTEDSGYAEEITSGLKEDTGKNNGINTYLSQDNLKPDLIHHSSYCSCDATLVTKDNSSAEFSAFEDYVEHAHSLKEGPLIIDPGPSDYYSQLLESKLEYQSTCACGEDESDFSCKTTVVKETIQHTDPSIRDLASPPDIYSQLFEGILDEVNEYVESFSELPGYYDSLETWPKVSMTDLSLCERETVV